MKDKTQNKTNLYADQGMTLTEVIAVVVGKRAAGIPTITAREEVADDFITEWAELFGAETAK